MSADKRDSPSPYGVLDFFPWMDGLNNDFYDEAKIVQAARLMKEAGIGFVRTDFLWEDIEPSKGKFVFDKYERIVRILAQNQIKILGVLQYNTPWKGAWNSAPDIDLFAAYARRTVNRFKGDVKYWEIWNEPDSEIYWQPQDGLETYTNLLKKVYPAIKEEDPSARVLMGGLSQNFTRNLGQIYKYGAKEYFDIVNIHPFTNPLIPNAMEILKLFYDEVRAVLVKNNDSQKEIWFTEIGCPGVKERNTTDWWLGNNPLEEEQAGWVKKVYAEPLEWKGVKKIFWAFFRDTPRHWNNGTDYFGLVNTDFSKKPAFTVYKNITAKNG
ncbi:MAG: cellulase family glycosylhydrolase [Candidatus Omnitrophica bacterium]|nr:cellulase family glycosylhydrolase [Candidatus Omnitrophota bacterium]MDD5610551.1 cellulase family glycosylhydrolase [Candidatus Omnitrophota bacterium]